MVGLEAAAELLNPLSADRPVLDVRVITGRALVSADQLEPGYAHLRLQTVDGSVTLDRAAQTITFSMPAGIAATAIVHPFLAAPALIAAHWLGRETFHAGAFMLDGRAWGVVGDKGDGKSTLLAWLAARGVAVLADDVVVVEEGAVLAGPRSIDLRADAATRLGIGEPLGLVGARERWRVVLGPVPAAVPVAGWVTLRWDDSQAPAVRTLHGAARLAAIAPHRGVHLPPVGDGAPLLELVALPVLELSRPRDWASADAAGERLLATLAT